MGDVTLLIEGLGIPESTRWRDGRVWLCNWGSGEVLAVTPSGQREVITRLAPQTLPFSIDWAADGRLLAVDGPRRLLERLEPDGILTTVADLAALGEGPANELVVDGAGNAFVNGGQDRRTLFIAAAQWRGMNALMSDGPRQTGQLLSAPGRSAAHHGRP